MAPNAESMQEFLKRERQDAVQMLSVSDQSHTHIHPRMEASDFHHQHSSSSIVKNSSVMLFLCTHIFILVVSVIFLRACLHTCLHLHLHRQLFSIVCPCQSLCQTALSKLL